MSGDDSVCLRCDQVRKEAVKDERRRFRDLIEASNLSNKAEVMGVLFPVSTPPRKRVGQGWGGV
jgi:hypothetical protein